MDFKFSKGSDAQDQMDGSAPKKSQSALLALLLILVGGFGYIYFFTGLIKPQTEPAPAPAPAPQVVKKPLPPRDGEVAPAKEAAPAKVGAPVVAAAPEAKPAPVPAPVAKPAPAPVPAAKPAPAPAPVAKPAPAPVPVAKPAAKPAPEAPKAVANKAPEKKAPAASPKATEQKKADVKPAVPDAQTKAVSAKAPEKKAAEKKADAEPAEKGAVKENWTVTVGSYVLEEALATDMARVRKAGLQATVQQGSLKKTPMNRLQVADFDSREAAQKEVDKLKKYTSDVFLIDNGGKFTVYAGSYLLDSRAASEKERLAAAGYKLTLKRIDIAIPTKVLVAGTYTSKKSADEALSKLKKAGLKPVLK